MSAGDDYVEYGFMAELYDHVVPYREREDIEFYLEAAKESGGPVLEVGCGTGRILVPIARSGIEIVGLDRSPYMLDVCRGHLEEHGLQVELVEADMREFDVGREFPLITIPFRPFQHLTTVKDQMACLQTIYRHLSSGGRFILDVFDPSLTRLTGDDIGEEIEEEPGFALPDGRQVVRKHRAVERDLPGQIVHNELIYYVTHPDGREERLVYAFPMRYLFRYEAEHLLARCGFEIEAVYSDYKKSPYGENYPLDMIFVTRKAV